MPQINVHIGQHDHDQIALLAKLNHITLSAMVRRIVQEYLDLKPRKEPKP